MDAIIFQWPRSLAHLVRETRDEAGLVGKLDIRFDNGAEFIGCCVSGLLERKGLGDIEVKEDGDEERGENHVEFMLSKQAMRMFGCLQWKREHVCCEVNVCDVPDTIHRYYCHR
jgi:hypothetical protein